MAGKDFEIKTSFLGVDKISPSLRKINTSILKVNKNSLMMGKTFTKSVNKMESSFSKFSGALKAYAGFSVIKSGIIGVATAGGDLEEQLIRTGEKFGEGFRKGEAGFSSLVQKARQLGAITEFDAKEVAEGMDFLALAGFKATDALKAIPGILNLATAAGMDLGMATDIVTDSIGAFGLANSDLTRMTDVFVKAQNSANLSIEQLFESVKQSAPVMSALKIPMETQVALLGALANSGIKAEKAGGDLKRITTNLVSPKGIKKLNALGVSVKDSEGNFRNIIGIIKDLKISLKDFGDVRRAGTIVDIFGKNALSSATNLLSINSAGVAVIDTVVSLEKQLLQSSGTVVGSSENIRSSFNLTWKSVKSAFTENMLVVFDSSKEGMMGMMNGLIGISRAISPVGEEFKNLESPLSVLLKFSKIVGFITVGFVAAKFAVLAFNLMIMANPIGLFLGLLTGLIVLLSVKYPNAMSKVADSIIGMFKIVWDFLAGFFKGLFGFFGKVAGFFGVGGFLGDVEKDIKINKKVELALKEGKRAPELFKKESFFGGSQKEEFQTTGYLRKESLAESLQKDDTKNVEKAEPAGAFMQNFGGSLDINLKGDEGTLESAEVKQGGNIPLILALQNSGDY